MRAKHPLIARVLRGPFNERPPQPKYTAVLWQVDSVVNWFRSIGPSASLSLQILTMKTAMLLVLTRQGKAKSRLFLSLVGEHNPVCSSTIARWLKSCLQKAGVDTSIFKAHSTWAVSTTKAAMAGMTVEEVIQAADWSGKGVF